MTRSEFDKIRMKFDELRMDFEEETLRYEALRPGQQIYVYDGYDNFAHEVIAVDVPNRAIHCYDLSLGGREVILRGCWYESLQPTL